MDINSGITQIDCATPDIMATFCEKVDHEGLLIRLLDKELETDDQDAVLAHLRTCQLCLSRMADIMLTDAQVRQTIQEADPQKQDYAESTKSVVESTKSVVESTEPVAETTPPSIETPPETEEIPPKQRAVTIKPGSRLQVCDLPVGTTLDTEIFDSRGQLLVGRNTPLTLEIIRGLQSRNITVVTLGLPGKAPQTALAREASIFKGRPDREFYAALVHGNVPASVSVIAKEMAIDSLKKAFFQLGPDSAIDLDDVRGTCDEMVGDLVEDEVTTLSIVDMYLTDSSLYHHSINVTAMFATICKALNLPAGRIKSHAAGAMLHDLGRVLLRKITKDKAPNQINIDRLHTEAAYKYLQGLGGTDEGPLNAVRNHHERYDGQGYPRGVDVRELGDYGQVLILANYYDRITWDANREMKAGFHQAANLIIQLSRKLVDTHIVVAFLNVFGHHPPGSWVELSTGEVGMVVQATPFKPRHPKVHIFYDREGDSIDEVIPLDLSIPGMPPVMGPFRAINGNDTAKTAQA